MSECMIVRRGGRSGGGSFDPNGAVLKVITSTNCTVLVTGTGYSETHQQADGFPRSGDANVTEHFFSIPASAFGTITVKATNTYGDNTKTLTVNTAGKVYEQLCGGINIILNSTFGLQDGYWWVAEGSSESQYNERYKRIERIESHSGTAGHLAPSDYIPITAYSTLTVTGDASSAGYEVFLRDEDDVALCRIDSEGTRSAQITDKYYPGATFYAEYFDYITEIVLS